MWLINSCLMGQWEVLNTPPLQMASLGIICTETFCSGLSLGFCQTKVFFLLLFFCQLPIKILTFVSRSLSCRRNYKPMVLSSYLTTGLITLFFFLFHDSQWKPFIQDIQAQEEYPRGISPVRVVETCRGHSRKWEPAHGSHVAWGWRLEWMGRSEQ